MKINHIKISNILIILSMIILIIGFPIRVSAALIVNGVVPNIISNLYDNTINVTGTDFVYGSIVSLDGYGSLTTTYGSNASLQANVPAGVLPGIYTVTVTNPDLTSASLQNALTIITEAPTPASSPIPPNITEAPYPAPTADKTPTKEPPNGYERPIIVVNGYGLSQDTISPGDSFTLYVTLYNAGQKYATNVVALFTPGDLIPRQTGGVVAVGEIAPGNHKEFGQPLVLDANIWSAVTSISMAVTYTDEQGLTYNETFVITLPVVYKYSSNATATPTPTQSPTPSIKPQLVISNYSTDITPLQPGFQFLLNLLVENNGNSTAKNVTMIVGGGSSTSNYNGGTQQPGGISGASGEFTNFAPIGSSNVRTLGNFNPGDIISASQALIVNVNTTPGAYPLKVSFVYTDESNRTFIDDQVVTLLIYRLPQVEISFYQDVFDFFTGQPNILPIQVVNLGRNSVVLGNMKVSGPDGQFSNNSILVGTLESGGYFTLDATFIPFTSGMMDLQVTIDYTNDFNQPEVITKTLSVSVIEQPIIEPPIDGGQNGGGDVNPPQTETFLHKVWRFILGLLGLDSGLNRSTNPGNVPQDTSSPEGPIIVPVQPPLKGP
jgi:hypothetical protein